MFFLDFYSILTQNWILRPSIVLLESLLLIILSYFSVTKYVYKLKFILRSTFGKAG